VTTDAVDRLAAALRDLIAEAAAPPVPAAASPVTWRERVWTAHERTWMSTDDVAEACGRSRAFVHRRCRRGGDDAPLPYRLVDGQRVFEAGAVRDWLRTVLDQGEPDAATR